MKWQDARSTLLKDLMSRKRWGLVSDMDGTLSHIVPRPADAQVTRRNRELLAAFKDRLPLVAIISGRGAADLSQRVGLPGLVYVGNHGLERFADSRIEVAPEAAPYRQPLEAALAEAAPHLVDGMEIEDKGATASIHYRRAADPAAVKKALKPLLKDLTKKYGLKLFDGRMIFELRPPVEINKGTALRRLIEDFDLDGALFLGDDTTDADALRVAQSLRAEGRCYALGVGVESDGTPPEVLDSADFLAASVDDVESFLAWLLTASSASVT
jgi:trehalose 6-phosphate phosphatase